MNVKPQQTSTFEPETGSRDPSAIIKIRDLQVRFDDVNILDNLSLDVYGGEILGIVGASGSGKSVLMRTILGLIKRNHGLIELFGVDYDNADEASRIAIDIRMGVLFQHGALFSSLNVLENIKVPMREYLELDHELMDELARLKLELVGLPAVAGYQMPSEISGGMTKRAALARALALDPDIVFLDEPTSGLDPVSAAEFDELIATLRATLGLTVVMVTHDLDSLYAVCDRIAVLSDRKVLMQGNLEALLASNNEWVQSYFRGKRGRLRENGGHHNQPAN